MTNSAYRSSPQSERRSRELEIVRGASFNDVAEALEERGLLEEVAAIVRAHYVTMYEACSPKRTKKIVEARHAAWKLLRDKGFSYPEIGSLWGVNHTSVMEALKKKR